jgi:hypothetical protein
LRSTTINSPRKLRKALQKYYRNHAENWIDSAFPKNK